MPRAFGRVVGQGTYDSERIALAIEWQLMSDEGQFINGGNNAVPVPLGLSDTELIAAAREGLALVIMENTPSVTGLTGADVMGCQL